MSYLRYLYLFAHVKLNYGRTKLKRQQKGKGGELKIVLYVSAFIETNSCTNIFSYRLNVRVTDPRNHQDRQPLTRLQP